MGRNRAAAMALALALGGGGAAGAEGWSELAGDDLYSAFRSRVLQYDDGAQQRFLDGGRTEYHKPNAWNIDGLWWVDSNLLCFVLTPGSGNCYKVKRHSEGLELKLEPANGGTLKLRYHDTK